LFVDTPKNNQNIEVQEEYSALKDSSLLNPSLSQQHKQNQQPKLSITDFPVVPEKSNTYKNKKRKNKKVPTTKNLIPDIPTHATIATTVSSTASSHLHEQPPLFPPSPFDQEFPPDQQPQQQQLILAPVDLTLGTSLKNEKVEK